MSEEKKPPERDLQAEQDHAEFAGWFEAQAYTTDDDGRALLAEAFTAGTQAARDLAAQQDAPELQITDCQPHDGASHLQINTRNHWQCVVSLAPILAEYEPQPADDVKPAPELAAAMADLGELLAGVLAGMEVRVMDGDRSFASTLESPDRVAAEIIAALPPVPGLQQQPQPAPRTPDGLVWHLYELT